MGCSIEQPIRFYTHSFVFNTEHKRIIYNNGRLLCLDDNMCVTFFSKELFYAYDLIAREGAL